VWKCIYKNYFKAYYEAPFAEKMLKDHLHQTLKETTMGNSNQKGLKQTTLKCDNVLE
jgi:hypothetical protein